MLKCVRIICVIVFGLLSVNAFASKWEEAIVIDVEGDTLRGEIKAGKHAFSDFIKFRDPQGDKLILKPEYYPEVITTEFHFKAVWFDREIIGYNTYCYGKLLSEGCLDIYDVNYPFRTCACKTQGTRKNNYVLLIGGQPLFIIDHNMFSDEIENLLELKTFLRANSDISLAVLNNLSTRSQFLRIADKYNRDCQEVNRTYNHSEISF